MAGPVVPLLHWLTADMDRCTFVDGFGRRFQEEEGGERLESLRLCDELAGAPRTEPLLVERAARLDSFHHPAFVALRSIERRAGTVVIVSEHVPGTRLAERLTSTPGATGDWIILLRKVVAAVAALHALGRDVSHGTIAPERIIIRPDGEPVLMEPWLGSALEALGVPRLRLWSQFRVPVAPTAGTARMDQRADVLQIAVLALSLAAGRLLGRDDFPGRIPRLLVEACGGEVGGGVSRTSLRSWLFRALQLDARSAFASAIEADEALTAILAEPREEEVRPVASVVAGASIEPRPLPSDLAAPPPTPTPLSGWPIRSGTSRLHNRHSGSEGFVPPGDDLQEPGPHAIRSRSLTGRVLRTSSVIVGLVTLWGATYLGARAYLGLDLPVRPGVLIVDSRPAGLEVLVDGNRHGVTPTTIRLRPGAYTLALRGGRSTTLVPVRLASGERRLERIEIERGGRAPTRISTEVPKSGETTPRPTGGTGK